MSCCCHASEESQPKLRVRSVVPIEGLSVVCQTSNKEIFEILVSSRNGRKRVAREKGLIYLQLDEEALQLERDRFGLLLVRAVKAPAVEGVAEFRRHVQRLDEAVEVARHSLIDQTDESCTTREIH